MRLHEVQHCDVKDRSAVSVLISPLAKKKKTKEEEEKKKKCICEFVFIHIMQHVNQIVWVAFRS